MVIKKVISNYINTKPPHEDNLEYDYSSPHPSSTIQVEQMTTRELEHQIFHDSYHLKELSEKASATHNSDDAVRRNKSIDRIEKVRSELRKRTRKTYKLIATIIAIAVLVYLIVTQF